MDQIWTFLLPVISAVSFASVFYLKKLTGDNPESFDPVKFFTTVIYGAILGLISVWMNIPMNETNFAGMYIAYFGLVAMVETVIKFIVRAVTPAPVPQGATILIDEEVVDKLIEAMDERYEKKGG